MQGAKLLSTLAVILIVNQQATCLTHTRTLMWTVKSVVDGSVDVRGVPGDPEDWVFDGIHEWAISYFSDAFSRSVSRRVALAFQYSTRRVFFNDKGFKEIFRITLQVAPYTPFTYDVNLEVVYGGISTEVNGLAMDWASGSIYWTDALYNWITVANASDYGVSRHIIHTGFSKPMGLAVYPKRGHLFWSVVGAVPKIERSTLGGADRMNFIDSDIDRPLGLSIDYKADHLYWVDDLRDTIERANLSNPRDRWTIHVGYRHSPNAKLFGLAVYNDFIFATDQVLMGINIYNKTTGSFIRDFTAVIFENIAKGIPYDIQMYDASLQEEIDSDCNRLGCSDICISDGGQRAHCICQEGYSLSPVDQRTCLVDQGFRMPQYLYSVGETLCGTDVIAADQEHVPTDVKCFYNLTGHEMVALGFDAYANFLFFSDSKDNVIHRMLLTNDVNASSVDVISANTGFVSGLAVDWIAENLYWTDRDKGVIMVSRLTGRYSTVLLKDIDHPASIAVNPLNGTMYWATPDTIYIANMDGTNARVLIYLPGSRFDGMVLDIRRDLLYWVDQSLPGIRSCHMNGSGLAVVIQADVSKGARTFRDVTVYESYIAWTDGMKAVYFGVTSPDNSSLVNILRGLQHVAEKTSHDIITYDYYLQPLLEPGAINPCDVDNDVHGCSQLCLLTPSGRKCRCSAGFRLINDSHCVSDPLEDNFLLFIDPYQKSAYQFDLLPPSDGSGTDRLRGIDLQSANDPSLVAFDLRSQNLFWFDEDRLKNSIKRISITEPVHYHILSTLTKDVQVDRIEAFDSRGLLLYVDSSVGSIFLLDVATGDLQKLKTPRNVYGAAVAVNEITGDIYWVDRLNRNIYKCHVTSSCSEESSEGSVVLRSWTGNEILGLNIAINAEMNLILWTDKSVYAVQNDWAILLFSADNSVSFTSVVVIGKIVYYTSWTGNAVFQYDVETKSTGITVQGFSRITDLKGYCSKCYNMSWTVPTPEAISTGGGQIGSGPIAGIVIGGLFFLLLLILLVIFLVVLWRRREKPTTPTVAYTNETYDHLPSSVVASLSRFPEGAQRISAYDYYDDDQKDKKDLPLPEVFADDPPLYFADDSAAGATGYDYFAKGAEKCEEKHQPPFPEVCAGDLPVFKIDGGMVNDHQDLLGQHMHPNGALPTYEDLENHDVSSSTHI